MGKNFNLIKIWKFSLFALWFCITSNQILKYSWWNYKNVETVKFGHFQRTGNKKKSMKTCWKNNKTNEDRISSIFKGWDKIFIQKSDWMSQDYWDRLIKGYSRNQKIDQKIFSSLDSQGLSVRKFARSPPLLLAAPLLYYLFKIWKYDEKSPQITYHR